MSCPFGFSSAAPPPAGQARDREIEEEEVNIDLDDTGRSGAGNGDGKAPAGGRFDYKRDPVSWFFQDQIRSEEEFAARKAELRAAARARLEGVFAKKGKRLVVGSDDGADGGNDDAWSVDDSELSAWDSDIDSVSGDLAGAAKDWRAVSEFAAPAEAALQLALWATAAIAAHTCWVSFGAMGSIDRFWGVVRHGWVATASFVAAAALAATAAALLLSMGRVGKHGLLAFQLAMMALYAAAASLALVAYVMPAALDGDLKDSAACAARAGAGASGAGMASSAARRRSKLCEYLPAVEGEVRAAAAALLRGCAAEAAAVVATVVAGAAYAAERLHVQQRALKHRRRQRRRRGGIPWDRIRIEDIGPVTICGGGGGGGFNGGGTRASAAAGKGGGCPFAGTAEKKNN